MTTVAGARPTAETVDGAARRLTADVLLLSPLPPPMGGLAQWTTAMTRSASLQERVAVFNTAIWRPISPVSRWSWKAIPEAVTQVMRLVFTLLARPRIRTVHISVSQMRWGIYKYVAFAWIARLFRKRVLMHLHGGDFAGLLDRLDSTTAALVTRTFRSADAVVGITPGTCDYLRNRAGCRNVLYLPNAIADDHPLFAIGPRVPQTGRLQLLFVGWLCVAKGLWELLQAAAQLGPAFDVHIDLVGPPAEDRIEERLREEAARLGLSSRVTFHGLLTGDALWARFAACDIFVLPSHTEGFPMSVLEAMAAGLPLVATPVGALPDILAHEPSQLVAVGDATALAARLRALGADPDLRIAIGAANRSRCATTYTVGSVAAALARVYGDAA